MIKQAQSDDRLMFYLQLKLVRTCRNSSIRYTRCGLDSAAESSDQLMTLLLTSINLPVESRIVIFCPVNQCF